MDADDIKKAKNFYANGWGCFVLGLVIAFYGAFILDSFVSRRYNEEAIEHGYGLHHPKTGKFIWKHELEDK